MKKFLIFSLGFAFALFIISITAKKLKVQSFLNGITYNLLTEPSLFNNIAALIIGAGIIAFIIYVTAKFLNNDFYWK